MAPLYEACVTSLTQARAAERAGADRIELCARMAVGGLTPPLSRLAAVRAAVALPIHVMIRPRAGNFAYLSGELATMRRAIRAARRAGADGVVLGVLTPDHRVDAGALAPLLDEARGLSVTFHRAFDEVPDPGAALEALVQLGMHRVLTSGGAATAIHGVEVLHRLVRQASGRMAILACGKIRADNAASIIAATGVTEVHAHVASARAMRALAQVVHGRAPH